MESSSRTNGSAAQGESGKSALGARVGQNLGFQFPIGIGRSMASDRSCRRRCIRSELELARQQLLHALVILDNHDQIYAFDADLQSPAAAGDSKERWCAPSSRSATCRYASAILGAKHKAPLDHVRNHRDALRVFQHFFRNAVIRARPLPRCSTLPALSSRSVDDSRFESAQLKLAKLSNATNNNSFFKLSPFLLPLHGASL